MSTIENDVDMGWLVSIPAYGMHFAGLYILYAACAYTWSFQSDCPALPPLCALPLPTPLGVATAHATHGLLPPQCVFFGCMHSPLAIKPHLGFLAFVQQILGLEAPVMRFHAPKTPCDNPGAATRGSAPLSSSRTHAPVAASSAAALAAVFAAATASPPAPPLGICGSHCIACSHAWNQPIDISSSSLEGGSSLTARVGCYSEAQPPILRVCNQTLGLGLSQNRP